MTAAIRTVTLLNRVVSSRCLLYEPRATLYSKYRGIGYYEWLAKIRNTDYHLTTTKIENLMKDRAWKKIRTSQQFDEELRATFGVELSVAHFIVARGGAVKFIGSDRWIENEQKHNSFWKKGTYSDVLPKTKIPGYNVEAVDATGLDIMYDSFDMLEDLQHIKYLNVSHCRFVDDWCFERLMPISETLVVLDVSGCPQVTERGLATVHKLPKLRRLICNDMTGVKNPALLKLLLEEMLPECMVDGLADYTDPEELEKSEPLAEPVFCVPPIRLAEVTTSAEFIFLDDLVEQEKREERRLLAPGAHTDSEPEETKQLPEGEIAVEKR